VARDIAAASASTSSGGAVTHAAERGSLVARIHAASGALVRGIDRHDRDARNSDGIRGLVVIVAICVLFTIVNWLLFVRTERRQAQERDRQLRSEEHTSELQSQSNLVCRLLLEKKHILNIDA